MNTTAIRSCAFCSTPLPDTRPQARYCDARCRRATERAKLRCHPAQCEECSTPFFGAKGARYCTIACGARANGAAIGAQRIKPKTCADCGGQYLRHSERKTKRCDTCVELDHWSNEDDALRLKAEREAVRLAALTPRACSHCAKPFTPKLHKSAVYCSRRCSIRSSNHRARTRRRSRETSTRVGPVSRAEIMTRDNWTCQICGDPLALNVEFPHPLYPSLDHIVPLSRGGVHTVENLQAAHVICNGRKSDRLDFETAPRGTPPSAMEMRPRGGAGFGLYGSGGPRGAAA